MRVALAVLFLSCAGESALELTDGRPRSPIPVAPQTEPQLQPPAPTLDPAAIPAGDPYLPPLAGHRLAVNGDLAVVSDPEGELADGRTPKLWVINLALGTSRSLTLPDGSRPGAVELTANAHAWVLLEGSGGVAIVDTSALKVNAFFPICRAPVNLALGLGDVWVACLSGEVVRLNGPVSTSYNVQGVPTRITSSGDAIFVALSDASIVQIDATGLKAAVRPERQNLTPNHSPAVQRIGNPNSPRRIIAMPNGGVALLHQQSVEGELTAPETPQATSPYSGAPPTPSTCPTPATRDAVSLGDRVTSGGMTFGRSRFLGTTLPLDAALSPDRAKLAVADGATGRVVLLTATQAATTTSAGCPLPDRGVSLDVRGASSVAYAANGTLVALSSGQELTVKSFVAGNATPRTVILRTRNVPIGFDVFHATPKPTDPTEPNVACASCHPAGMNNGGALTVKGVTHKVMSLGSHLAGATGVHWDNQPFQAAVVDGTWKTNMQGKALTAVEAASLKAFVEQLKLPPAPIADAARIEQGRDAFFRAACAGCHSGTNYTNNSEADVGRGRHRVPSLVGLAYSAPYMADGCAKTLEQRFSDTRCGGGDLHGRTSMLSADEVAALVTFLKTL